MAAMDLQLLCELLSVCMVVDVDRPGEVVIVSASSAYHIGESFLTGGRRALEEAMWAGSNNYAPEH